MDLPDAGPRPPAHPTSRGARAGTVPTAADLPVAGTTAAGTPVAGPLWARSLLLVVPAVWLGLVIGISLIEAPLKFTAPGITIPLGLGIGRRVFMAMNLVEVVLAVLLLVSLWRSVGRPGRNRLWILGWCATAVLVVKMAVIKPFLNERTDAVLAGDFEGGSTTHYAYIAAEVVLIAVLVLLLVSAARALLRVPAVGQPVHAHDDQHEPGQAQVHPREAGDRQQETQ